MPDAGASDTPSIDGETVEMPPFIFPIRVYYEDTDAGGVVYHANYLRFAERARTEMLRSLGVGQRELRDEQGLAFVVRRCAIEFAGPARLDDALDVVTTVKAVRGAAIELEQTIRRSGEAAALVSLDLVIAAIAGNGRPARVPAWIKNRLTGTPPARA